MLNKKTCLFVDKKNTCLLAYMGTEWVVLTINSLESHTGVIKFCLGTFLFLKVPSQMSGNGFPRSGNCPTGGAARPPYGPIFLKIPSQKSGNGFPRSGNCVTEYHPMGPWAHGTPKSMKVDYKIQQGHVPKSLGRVLNRKQKPLWDSPRPLNALRNIHIYIYIYRIYNFQSSFGRRFLAHT